MDAWYQISLMVPIGLSDAVSGLFFELGSCGLQTEDGPDAGHVRMKAYFPSAQDQAQVLAGLKEGLGLLSGQGYGKGLDEVRVCVDPVPQEDWSSGWRQHFKPVFPTPRIAVCPPWNRVPEPAGGCRVVIEPKMAFGTGSHETTRLALMAIEEALEAGQCMLDVGTGSGILSIAAVKLGAAAAVAVDTDPLAVENARENISANGVEGRVDLRLGSVLDVDGTFDLVVANIIRRVLAGMLPALKARLRPHGRLILGGLLDREASPFSKAVEAAGLGVKAVLHEGEWVCMVAEKR